MNFICIGASKSGTTSLHSILSSISEISLPKVKETQFFVKEKLYLQGLNKYSYFFDNNKKYKGEVCPQYMSSNRVQNRIFKSFGGDLKIIMMLRDPIERCFSHYSMKTRSFENLSFDSAVERALNIAQNPVFSDLLTKHLDFNCFESIKSDFELDAFRYTRYIYPGFYYKIYSDYKELFGSKNIYIIKFDDFIADPIPIVLKLLSFLNIKIDLTGNIIHEHHDNTRRVYTSIASKVISEKIAILIKYLNLDKTKIDRLKKVRYNYFMTSKKDIFNRENQNYLKQLYADDIIKLENATGNNYIEWIK